MIKNLSVRPGVHNQLPFCNQTSHRSFHIGHAFRDSLFQKPPLHYPSHRVFRLWIGFQIIENLPFNWRFAAQFQTKGFAADLSTPRTNAVFLGFEGTWKAMRARIVLGKMENPG